MSFDTWFDKHEGEIAYELYGDKALSKEERRAVRKTAKDRYCKRVSEITGG